MSGLVWLRPHCRVHCLFAVRRKLKACAHTTFAGASFVFEVMVASLLTLNFDFSFSIDFLFPHKILLGLEVNSGWLSRSVCAELAAYSGLPHGTSLHIVALNVAQQSNWYCWFYIISNAELACAADFFVAKHFKVCDAGIGKFFYTLVFICYGLIIKFTTISNRCVRVCSYSNHVICE